METRTILKIVLGLLTLTVVGISFYVAYTLLRPASTVIVKEVIVDKQEEIVPVNPWSQEGKRAISLVKSAVVEVSIVPEKKKTRRRNKKTTTQEAKFEKKTLEEILQQPSFASDVLKVHGKLEGWKATWWGETKHGSSYFLVTYAFKDAQITVGPQWLVDLKTNKVIAKNLPALMTTSPKKGRASKYYDKNDEIISTIAAHRFESKINLAGALLLYFESREDTDKDDTILGWTVQHERGNLFKAYFQWVENKEPTYAEFEFDFDAKALKAINLQAANIMRVGDAFSKKRVSIMPSTYDASARRGQRWIGRSKKVCKKNKAGCRALDIILSDRATIESIEWLLTAQANTSEAFVKCIEERRCRWIPMPKAKNGFSVKYMYRLGNDADKSIAWDVDLRKRKIKPSDRVSNLAFSTLRPR